MMEMMVGQIRRFKERAPREPEAEFGQSFESRVGFFKVKYFELKRLNKN